MTRIVFLDIDDVLLTARAHALPANITRIEQYARDNGAGRTLFEALPVTFDPVAVAWLNRLCRLAGAKIVVHSSWRHSVGGQETLAHLVGQGVEADLLHGDPICPRRGFSSLKCHDISSWLSQAEERGEAVERAVILDDESNVWPFADRYPHVRHVHVDDKTGFGPKEYGLALDWLGGEDPYLAKRQARNIVRAEYHSAETDDVLVVLLIDGVAMTYVGTGFTAPPSMPPMTVPQAEIDRLRAELPHWPQHGLNPDMLDRRLVDRAVAGDPDAVREIDRLGRQERMTW